LPAEPSKKKTNYLNRSKKYYSEEKYKEVLIEFKNVLQIDPKYAEGYYQMALTYLKLQQPWQAYGSLLKTVELDPDRLDAQIAIGEILLIAHRIDASLKKAHLDMKRKGPGAAIDEYCVVLKDRSDDPDLYLRVGLAHLFNNEPLLGEESLKKALQLKPEIVKTRMALAGYYLKAKKYANARELVNKLIKKHPDFFAAYLVQEETARMTGDTAGAISAQRR